MLVFSLYKHVKRPDERGELFRDGAAVVCRKRGREKGGNDRARPGAERLSRLLYTFALHFASPG